MYNHTSHSKVIVTAKRKQKAKYVMLVQTMLMVKLSYVSCYSDEQQSTTVKLSNLLYSSILVQVSRRLPRKRKRKKK